MTSRKHIPPAYEGHSVPNFIPHIALSASHRQMEPLPPELLDRRLAVQAAEIEQLAVDNHRLAATHGALRQDLAAAQQEIERLTDHIRSMQTETDIQIRLLLDKISKMEVHIRAGESVKKELQQAHSEARNLALARQELNAQIQKASQELEKARAGVKKLPEMHAELEGLRKEHQRLRMTFEHEKGLNIEKVGKMRIMEKDMVGMHGELERLRAEVFNAEQRAQAPAPYPYGGAYANPHTFYPPAVHGNGGYVDNYGRPAVLTDPRPISPGMVPYGGSVAATAPGGVGAVVGAVTGAAGIPLWPGTAATDAGGNPSWQGTAVTGAAGNPSWPGTYDASHFRR